MAVLSTYGLPLLLLSMCAVVLPVVLAAMITYHIRSRDKIKMWPPMLTFLGLTYGSHCLNALSWLTLSILTISSDGSFHWPWCIQFAAVHWTYGMGRACMDLFFVSRLYVMFRASTWRISKRKAWIMVGSILTTYVVLFFALMTMRTLDLNDHHGHLYSFHHCHELGFFRYPILATSLVGMTIISVILGRAFISRLVQMVVLSKKNGSLARSSSVRSTSGKPDATDAAPLEEETEVMIRQTNLVMLAVVTTHSAVFVADLTGHAFVLMLDNLVNAMCMYLTFAFAQPLYRRIFPCHHCCYYTAAVTLCRCCRIPGISELQRMKDVKERPSHLKYPPPVGLEMTIPSSSGAASPAQASSASASARVSPPPGLHPLKSVTLSANEN